MKQKMSKKKKILKMVNAIHPSKAGYRDWWTPVMEEYLYNYLG